MRLFNCEFGPKQRRLQTLKTGIARMLRAYIFGSLDKHKWSLDPKPDEQLTKTMADRVVARSDDIETILISDIDAVLLNWQVSRSRQGRRWMAASTVWLELLKVSISRSVAMVRVQSKTGWTSGINEDTTLHSLSWNPGTGKILWAHFGQYPLPKGVIKKNPQFREQSVGGYWVKQPWRRVKFWRVHWESSLPMRLWLMLYTGLNDDFGNEAAHEKRTKTRCA